MSTDQADLAAKLEGKLVIRFDGPPGNESGRFIEAERDGRSVRCGEWVQDGEYWLLVIDHEPAKCFSPDRPFTPRVIEILRNADSVAFVRECDYLGTLHLLLGLLDSHETYAMQAITQDLDHKIVEKIREQAKEWLDGFERKKTDLE